jgi:tetratricopeptide (TPR) repeat protein
MGMTNQALNYYKKDLEIQERLADQNGIANAFNNLGNLYDDLGEHRRALEYYQKSMGLLEHSSDREGYAIACNNVASMHFTLKDYRLALEYYLKSLKIREALNDQRGLAGVYSNLGMLCQRQKLFFKARAYFQQSMDIQEQHQDKKGLIINWYNLGVLLQEQGQYAAALPWCEKSLLASREIGMLRAERNACHCLYTAYKGAGKPRLALDFHEQFTALNDSLEKENTTQRLERLEFEKHVIADSLGKEAEKQQLAQSYENTLNWYLVAGIVVLLLALVFLARMLYFQKRSERLQSKTRLLERQQLINEIDLLRTQVNPHFLFNSLSILSSLVHVNPDLSEQFIDRLSKSYRYILDQKDQTLVTLRTEVDFIQSYAFLLKIRFENKFDLQIQLDEPALNQWKIAPLTLQLLVENAVKHNRMSSREPLQIRVCLEADTLVVSNALRPRQQVEHSTGMGLHNIIHRYELLCDRTVRAGEIAGDFVVKIPMIK